MRDKPNPKEPVETGSLFEFLVKGQSCSMLMKLSDNHKPQSPETTTHEPTASAPVRN